MNLSQRATSAHGVNPSRLRVAHVCAQDEALEVYEQLRELQEDRYSEDYSQKELAVAECYKLSGDVFVAMREFSRCETPRAPPAHLPLVAPGAAAGAMRRARVRSQRLPCRAPPVQGS